MPKDLGEALIVETLSRIDQNVSKLDDRMDNMGKEQVRQGEVLVRQQAILDEHVRRTNLLESKIAHDVAAMEKAFPKAIDIHLNIVESKRAAKRKKHLLTSLKVLAALAGTGVGAASIKALLTFILANWH